MVLGPVLLDRRWLVLGRGAVAIGGWRDDGHTNGGRTQRWAGRDAPASLDPPYADTANRDPNIYTVDCLKVAHDVREWAIEHGSDPLMRIVLAGYEGEHDMPAGWRVHSWQSHGGMANIGDAGRDGTGNFRKERLWFSPHCMDGEPVGLFAKR